MARTAKNLAIGQITSDVITTIYTAPSAKNTSASVLAFTNASDQAISIEVYQGNGTDYLQRAFTLPAGVGREGIYYGFQHRVINTTETVKLKADSSAAFNYTMSGAEVDV